MTATKKAEDGARTQTLSIFPMKTTHSTVKAALKQRAGLKPPSFSLTDATKAVGLALPSDDLPDSGGASAP